MIAIVRYLPAAAWIAEIVADVQKDVGRGWLYWWDCLTWDIDFQVVKDHPYGIRPLGRFSRHPHLAGVESLILDGGQMVSIGVKRRLRAETHHHQAVGCFASMDMRR